MSTGGAVLTMIRSDFAIFVRGVLMGMADVVPGVSGGTMALLTGIYPRLIQALAGFHLRTLRCLVRGDFSAVAVAIDFRFLLALGAGIGVGLLATILTLVGLLRSDTSRGYVLAVFLGMLLAGAFLMVQRLTGRVPADQEQREEQSRVHLGHWGWAAVGLVIAGALSLGQQMSPVAQPSYGYVGLCGFIGITAMILPGISGAMLLLLLGVYGFLVHIPTELLHRENIGMNLTYLAVFALGCLAGLLATTRLLKWLLERWPKRVSCFLLGLMLGTIPCLWPFQTNLSPDQPKLALRVYVARGLDPQAVSDWLMAATVVGTLAGVLSLERLASRRPGGPQ